MYAAHADMTTRFGEEEIILLTDVDSQAGVVDSVMLDQALSDASAEIDGYIGGRYPLPLADAPPVLVRVCCDIARYFLHDEHAPERVAKRYDDAIKFLKSLGKGEISLVMPADAEAVESRDTAQITSDGRVFDRDDSKAFI